MTAGARVTDGLAVALTFEWAGNSTGVLLRKGDSGVRRVVAVVFRGEAVERDRGARGSGWEAPERAGCRPCGSVRL